MIPDRDIDHVGQGLALLLNQYKNKPRLAGWARAYLRQCQLLEDAIYGVLIDRLIQNAQGVQCDAIGRIVGELRRGLDDPTYKIFIGARVRINRSRGNTTDVLDVMGMITATSVIFGEYVPACLFIEALTIMDRDPVLIYTMLHDTKAAGVKLTLIVPTTDTKAFHPTSVFESSTGTDGDVAVSGGVATFHSPGHTFARGLAGGHLVISGAGVAANNGTFPVTSWTDAHHIKYNNPSAVDVDGNDGSIHFMVTNGVTPIANNANYACGDANDTSATITSANSDLYVLTDGMQLTVAFDAQAPNVFTFLAADFVDIGNAKTEEVVTVLNRERRRRFFAQDVKTPASVECANAQTYNFSVGPYTLTVKIDGGAPQTLTLLSSDFTIPGAATAAQVAAHLDSQLVGADALVTSSGTKVTIASHLEGSSSEVEITGGSANAVLGFSTSPVLGTSKIRLTTWRVGTTTDLQVSAGGANAVFGFSTSLVTGTGDSTFGLLSDAVTVRDPNAEPITAPPGPPVIIFVDPGSTP